MASSSSSKLRSCYSLPNLILSSLNLILFLLSSASFAPILLLRAPPTSSGWALLAVSATTVLSSLLGFFSHFLTHCFFFLIHMSLILVSSFGQALGFFAFFVQPEQSLRLLGCLRGRREVRAMIRIEEGLLVAMFAVQSVVLVSVCVVQRRWVKEYEGVEEERDKAAKKRGRRMARVQVESMASAKLMAEAEAREMEERMRSKHGQLVKNEFEACLV